MLAVCNVPSVCNRFWLLLPHDLVRYRYIPANKQKNKCYSITWHQYLIWKIDIQVVGTKFLWSTNYLITFWYNASWKLGLNFSFKGLIASNPCRLNTCSSESLVIVRPSYRFFKCGFLSLTWSLGTACVACPRMSATSSKSLQKLWMPKILASSICLVKRLRRFSLSASDRLYLSYDKKNFIVIIAEYLRINIPTVLRSLC